MKICVVMPGTRPETAPVGRAGCALVLITGLTISPHSHQPTPARARFKVQGARFKVRSERGTLNPER